MHIDAVARSPSVATRRAAVGAQPSYGATEPPSVAGAAIGSVGLLSAMTSQAIPSPHHGAARLVSDGSVESWAHDLNDGDRALLDALTGGSSDADSLSPSHTAILAALSQIRSEGATGAITPEQFDALCDRAQVAMFQAGETFDQSVRAEGARYLEGTPAVRNHAADLVNNPAYALGEVETYASRPLGMMVKLPVPADGGEGWVDPKIVQESFDRWKGFYQTVQSAHANARSLVEHGKAAGKSGAEIYADILRDQLSQPASYWEARDPDHLQGDLKSQVRAELSALETAIARGPGKA